MMNILFKAVALLGIADSLWLAADPPAWAKFWRQGVDKISDEKQLARILAAFEFAFCIWLLKGRR